jgi:nucleotide-binding universal stress UspA family protein
VTTEPKHILVPLDFSQQSLRALAYAQTIAKPFAASLDLLHVVPNPLRGRSERALHAVAPELCACPVLTVR